MKMEKTLFDLLMKETRKLTKKKYIHILLNMDPTVMHIKNI